MTVLADVEALSPITLDELVSRAGLQARVDRKYVLPESSLNTLLEGLSTSTLALQIDGNRSFAYRSVYLDTPDLRSYHSAGRGQRRRFKVRGRGYLDSGLSWLEVKTRAGRGVTVKTRVPHADVEQAPLTDEGLTFVGRAVEAHRLPTNVVPTLHPVLVTTYRRLTLYLPGEDGRADSRGTLDTRLAFGAPGSGALAYRAVGLAVVETKGGTAPSALDRQLWRMGHRPVAISKYAAGLSVVRGDLPDLKWHRTLRRYLRPSLISKESS